MNIECITIEIKFLREVGKISSRGKKNFFLGAGKPILVVRKFFLQVKDIFFRKKFGCFAENVLPLRCTITVVH